MASIADLRPGWHQLDADILIDEAGNATLCEPLPDDEPIAGLGTSRCPADAPAVDPIDIGELDAMRPLSPLVVHVNDDGTNAAVSANNGGERKGGVRGRKV